MKSEIRILGIDDMPFTFQDRTVGIVGVIMRGNSYIEGILHTAVEVDGNNATERIISLIQSTQHRDQLRLVMTDGSCVGGFNVIDGEEIFQETGIPLMTVTTNKPDPEAVKHALKLHFCSWEDRWHILQKGKISEIVLDYPVYVKCFGITIRDAKEALRFSIIRGAKPEPLRIAHLVARGIKTGDSSN